jgi:hypothetical protein
MPISMSDDYHGECGGTGQMFPATDVLLVTLAGYAAESGFGTAHVDFSGACADFEYARSILASAGWLRHHSETVDDALTRYFYEACEFLQPHADAIDRLQTLLLTRSQVPAELVAATCASAQAARRDELQLS